MATRDGALDLVKGVLVIGMLVIHATFLTIPPGWLQTLVYPQLLGFVSGSWVVISGFIIGTYYRPGFVSAPVQVSRRLLGRGWRLVAIFAVANVLLGKIAVTCSLAAGPVACDPVRVFLLGDLTGQTFEILVAIGYLLMLSPLALWWPRVFAAITVLLLVAVPLTTFVTGATLPGLPRMLICGFAGIVLGQYVTPGLMQRLLADPPSRRRAWTLAVAAFGVYVWLAETGLASHFQVTPYLAYVLGALLIFYLGSVWIDQQGLVGRQLSLMARYSLPSYMWQMAILQALGLLFPGSLLVRSLPLALLATLALLLLSLHAGDWLRSRVRLVDSAYRVVFG